jgi:initiation factor 1A
MKSFTSKTIQRQKLKLTSNQYLTIHIHAYFEFTLTINQKIDSIFFLMLVVLLKYHIISYHIISYHIIYLYKMGRNQFGGNKQKSMANNKSFEIPMRYSTCALELYAKVMKACGNGMFQIQDNEGKLYIGHVRGKMRGKSKRSNLIRVNDIVLVGLREWESHKTNVDILYIYEENQVYLIQQNRNCNTDNIIETNDMIEYDYSNQSKHENTNITAKLQEIQDVKNAFSHTNNIDIDKI